MTGSWSTENRSVSEQTVALNSDQNSLAGVKTKELDLNCPLLITMKATVMQNVAYGK